jgi:hypothetical protein
MANLVRYRVHYRIATYSGSIDVELDENADQQDIILAAERRILAKSPPPPIGHRSYRVERL